MKPLVISLAASLMLAACGSTPTDSNRSLNQARSEVIKGTSPGITLIGGEPKADAAPAATAATSPPGVAPSATAAAPSAAAKPPPPPGTWGAPLAAPAGTPAPTPAARAAAPAAAGAVAATSAAAAPADESIGARLRRLFPPSGESLNSAKRHDQATSGIPLPTAAPDAKSAAEPTSKAPQAPKP